MKTILVLAQNPELPCAIRSILESERYRLIHRPDIEEAEPLLKHGALDACLLDADQPQVQALWVIERLKELAPSLPIFVFSATRTPEWEEQLYTRGVNQVLAKPIRPRLLATLIERLNTKLPAASAAPTSFPAALPPAIPADRAMSSDGPRSRETDRLLAAFEEAVTLTPVTLAASDLFDAVLPKLRKVLGVRRVAVFLRGSASLDPGQPQLEESRRLHLVSAAGVSRNALRDFSLSIDSGCGAVISAWGRGPHAMGSPGRLATRVPAGAERAGDGCADRPDAR
ncbi:MAG: response regulator [Verrucomicrobia bacterium]|nr:response regulator [Verrucomicrobiota bacterium]